MMTFAYIHTTVRSCAMAIFYLHSKQTFQQRHFIFSAQLRPINNGHGDSVRNAACANYYMEI